MPTQDLKKLISQLHPLERKVLPLLRTEKAFAQLVAKSGLQEVEVMRALEWLENKGALHLEKQPKKEIYLEELGKAYQRTGLPERRLLKALGDAEMGAEEIKKAARLNEQEFSVSLGLLKRKAAIDIRKDKEQLKIKLTPQGKKLMESEFLEEQLLKKKFPLGSESLKDEEKFAFEELRKRSLLTAREAIERTVLLKPLGEALLKEKIEQKETLGRVTSEVITQELWRKKEFRAYDVAINVPARYPGKKHFVTQAIDYARRIWLDMGFREMTGPMIQTSFWNFDALFTAQDHPVREMQDTFFVGSPAKGTLPGPKLVQAIREMHEHGGKSGSTGWRSHWDGEEAKLNVLRTHTTVLSAQTLAAIRKDLKKNVPAKYFAIGKCFRNEALDWSHLFEFNQTEGIVIDPDANFRHLLGYLKEFFSKMGFPQARFRPAYFPYTEPSIEIDVYHPGHKKWIELGGAGIFRPEVTIPLLGEDIPVLAWGPGFDRLILDYYQLADIRDLYKNDIKQLREMKMWMR